MQSERRSSKAPHSLSLGKVWGQEAGPYKQETETSGTRWLCTGSSSEMVTGNWFIGSKNQQETQPAFTGGFRAESDFWHLMTLWMSGRWIGKKEVKCESDGNLTFHRRTEAQLVDSTPRNALFRSLRQSAKGRPNIVCSIWRRQ